MHQARGNFIPAEATAFVDRLLFDFGEVDDDSAAVTLGGASTILDTAVDIGGNFKMQVLHRAAGGESFS